ncbi:CotH kinase family protein [Polaribacter pectinis]|uniref:CotH kinase family protein n=1 Tax=Polaribacter pectinis TaxID=2738844 RepID=A0A7G9LCM6_9FLAO|nr:CotH kinase family protein [Polaribacter pectinis]QNM86375.1 CotH kinase family protein [Polaribacter pectinis]
MHKNNKIRNSILLFLCTFFIGNSAHFIAQTIRINEVVSSNTVHADEDGDYSDWFEIHNYGNQEVSMNAWSLTDDANDLTQWTLPDITLAPNEYLFLWASSKNRTEIKFPRTLINQGDTFNYLIPTSEPDSNWKNSNFDDANWSSGISGFGYNDGDDATIIPNGTQAIYLRKKFVIHNLATVSSIILDIDYDDAFVAYINGHEVARANINGTPPAYNSTTITDHEAQMYTGGIPERFVISDFNSFLTEGENILSIQAHNISASSSDFTIIPFLSAVFTSPNNLGIEPPTILNLTKSHFHTNFKISSSSETLILANAAGTIVNQITAENLPTNTSIGISKTSGDIVSYIETTPGLENSSQEFLGSVQNEVTFSHDSGVINSAISLVLSGTTSQQVIRYTINGDTPTESSAMYTTPIQINATTTVKARIFSTNYIPSAVYTKSYVYNGTALTFTDSNLPIVIIVTDNGAEIPDEPKIFGTMKIIKRPDGTRNFVSDADNEEYLDYSGTIGIEIRGSSSQALPKKPYGFTTLTEDRSDNDNVKLLGMPKENDWILNSFAFDDSMMRDYLSYEMARQMGQYAVNLKYCEVIINGDYKGLYALSEKIKIDGDRVDIVKLANTDNASPEVTGGYLIQTDRPSAEDPEVWYNNGAGYIIERPKPEDITQNQSSYIEAVFRNLDQTANNSNITSGYPSVIDVTTFVDYMLMAEIASNADAYALSTYYHKDRGGKLRAGPIWDYNLTYGNDLLGFFTGAYYDRSLTNVWQFQYSNVGANFWRDLFNNPDFKCYLSKRFNDVTQTGEPLNYDTVSNFIDNTVALISEAVVRENERWQTIDNFSGEITNMKSWLQERITWMKNNLGAFNNCTNVQTPSLVITKISYNPKETSAFPESDDLEFIEITNTGNTSVNLTGIYLRELGVSYQFPINDVVAAGASIFLAANETTFKEKYGVTPFGTFIRDLSNKSHHLILSDAFGNTIDQVKYEDKAPWPESADGDGFYLELMDVNSDNSIASNWTATSDATLSTNRINNDISFNIYPNPTREKLTIQSQQIIREITVLNLLGQKVKKFQVNFKLGEINISDLKKGMYFLNVKLIDGNNSSLKIIKK